MSVTVFLRTKQGQRRVTIQKPWLMLGALLPLLVVVVAASLTRQAQQQSTMLAAQLAEASKALQPIIQPEEIEQLRTELEVQVGAFTSSFAQMQARMNRVEALGMALSEQSDLSEQFDFNAPIEIDSNEPTSSELAKLEQLLEEIKQLQQRLQRADNYFGMLESVERNHHIDDMLFLSGPPIVEGTGRRSSPYGYRSDPFSKQRTLHRGLDFAAKEGTSIIATGAGVVSFVGVRNGYGNIVEIDHGKGVKTRYAHNKVNLVELGQRVDKGQEIAQVGNTGRSTGPHVHYEVMINNRQVNPAKYVDRDPRS